MLLMRYSVACFCTEISLLSVEYSVALKKKKKKTKYLTKKVFFFLLVLLYIVYPTIMNTNKVEVSTCLFCHVCRIFLVVCLKPTHVRQSVSP